MTTNAGTISLNQATDIPRQITRRRDKQARLILWGLGAVSITPGQVVAILAARVGLELPWEFDARQQAVVMAIRLPRVILGIVIGSALAVSGAALQGLFRNPLAAPSLIGISSGAALGATTMIVLGSTVFAGFSGLLGYAALPLAAFTGGILVTVMVYRLSLVNGRTVVATMLLAGIAINAMAGAGTGIFVFVADDDQLRNITFWSLGSLGGATWRAVWIATPFALVSIYLSAAPCGPTA